MIIKYIKSSISHMIPDSLFLRYQYKKVTGKRLCLRNPKTFNEKLQWLKLYDRKELYHTLVDKYAVKDYVSKIIGNEYLIPTLGIWYDFDAIDFKTLPNKFVLKATHDSGGVVICNNKEVLDLEKTKRAINNSLSNSFYWSSREWPYKGVKPRIIAEKYITPDGKENLDDYKMLCFNGKFDNVMVCEGRHTKRGVRFYHFDREWNFLPYVHYDDLEPVDFNKLKPQNYEKMIEIAEKLCKGFPEVRIDLYNVNGKIYFGEITLYQASGYDMDFTDEAQIILGDKIILPSARQ